MAANKTQPHVLYPELSYDITGVCFDTHNELGPYGKEKQYGDTIEEKFKKKRIDYTREVRIGDSGNIIDFLVGGVIALELKAKRTLIGNDYRQIQNYLQASGVDLGMLVNFRCRYVKPIRILRLESKSRQSKNNRV